MTSKRSQNRLSIGVPLNAQFKELVYSHDYNDKEMFRLRFWIFDEDRNLGESIATNQVFTLRQTSNLFGGKSEASMMHSKWRVELGVNSRFPHLLTVVSFEPAKWDFSSGFIAYQCDWQGCLNSEPDTLEKTNYKRDREKKDQKFAATIAARENLNAGIRGELPAASYEFLFGCTHAELLAHIESTFQPGWNWKNRFKVWHLDHVIPLRDFDLLDPSEELKANHFSNLRAISREENLRKHANKSDLVLAN